MPVTDDKAREKYSSASLCSLSPLHSQADFAPSAKASVDNSKGFASGLPLPCRLRYEALRFWLIQRGSAEQTGVFWEWL